MKHALKLAALLLLGGLGGCDTLGEGNTIEKIEIVPATRLTQIQNFDPGDTYLVPQCLRDELIVLATFTDGSQVNFSSRVDWSSSDPAVLQVSNGDIPAVIATNNPADDGSFYETAVDYVAGTIIPGGIPGDTAVVTAKFAGLSDSINLEIRKPTLRVVRVPADDFTETLDAVPMAQGTVQRLSVLVDLNGRTFPLSDLSGSMNDLDINPMRWVLAGATFEPQDDDVSGDIDRWVIRDGNDDPVVALHISSGEGIVTAYQAGTQLHEITAESYQCRTSLDATLRPQADVRVGALYDDPATAGTDERLVLSREADFNGGGFASEDFVTGTSQLLQVHASVDAGVDANGDGDPIEDVILTQQARYLVLPLNGACEVQDDLLGCTSNLEFQMTSTNTVRSRVGVTEGETARVHACHPLCTTPRATLEADGAAVATVGSGVPVNFTAAMVDPPTGLTLNYVFDFGDGTTQGPQAGASASHAYADAGTYTATVRVVDAAYPDEFLSQNAGAARIVVGVVPDPANDAPIAELSVTVTAGTAPLSVALSAAGSTDPDTDDSITVYELDPGDGTPVIRQTRPTFVHVYRDGSGGPFTPTLRVYDESGAASTMVSDATDGAITVDGTAPADVWSNAVDFRARDATLCSVALLPDAAAAAAEPAFTFPSLQFQALGSFVANTETDTCADPLIGTQRITRFVFWRVRPQGDADTLSTIATITTTADSFRPVGQVQYFEDVATDTVLDVSAVPISPFTGDITPAPTTLTVQPCAGCTP